MSAPVVYFTRRIESFIKDGIEPPSHLRTDIKCDVCSERCWANRENWKNRDKRYDHKIVCDVCYKTGRHRTG